MSQCNHGIEGDAHAGNWHRQVSLLADESVDRMREKFPNIAIGAFAENILTEGIELFTLPIGTKLKVGPVLLEVTQIGKECHKGCAIRNIVGDCVMPREGIFAIVLKEGIVKAGDKISIQYHPEYHNLEENILDVIAEQQAKLGYRKEMVRLYYPSTSLSHLLHLEGTNKSLDAELKKFSAYVNERLGSLTITKIEDRYCLCCDEKASEYVHEKVDEKSFIFKLIALISNHDTKIEAVENLFQTEGIPFEKENVSHGEFDVLFHFTDSKDRYYYCFKQEGCHLTFHRFLPEDYEEFGF